MTYGWANLRLRPVRFAFLVDPAEKSALLQAIEINSFLWGGVYNPIIPVIGRVAKPQRSRYGKYSTSRTILDQYLEVFDPDFIVALGKYSGQTFDLPEERLVTVEKLLGTVEMFGFPQYGIGLFEVAGDFYNKELKFVRTHSLEFLSAELAPAHEPFLASVFGRLPSNIAYSFKQKYEPALNAQTVTISISNYAELFAGDKTFIRRLTSHGLSASGYVTQCLFFLDASKTNDVVDYWNLRALGWNVIPIAKQSAHLESTKKLALNFVNANYQPERHPGIYNAMFAISRSIPFDPRREDEAMAFVRSLDIEVPGKAGEAKLAISYVYPPAETTHFWPGSAQRVDAVARSARHSISGVEGTFPVKTLDPEFITTGGVPGVARFANDLDLRVSSGKELMAEVIPEGGRLLPAAIGGFDYTQWRFSKNGITYLAPFPDWTIDLTLPKAEELYSRWLKTHNWQVQPSPAGRIVRQMFKHLGGMGGMQLLADENVISLINSLNAKKLMSVDEFWGELQKIANYSERLRDPKDLLQRLTDAQIVRLGIEVQCPVCTQRSWYTVADANYELGCLNCLEHFSLPPNPRDIKWAYRTFGPFSASVQDYGSYSVLLTLRFFSSLLHAATTAMLSFEANKEGSNIEADLGLLFQRDLLAKPSKAERVFAECKTYNSFEAKDTAKLLALSHSFPGSILVVATLKKDLSDGEKRVIKSLLKKLAAKRRIAEPQSQVLILTGTELFSFWRPPPLCWEQAGGRHAVFSKEERVRNDLRELGKITQQIYLEDGE
jgi:hypothetical protein